MAEDNGKQNPNEPYTNKYRKHVDGSYDDKFSKAFKSYLEEDAVYSFISSATEGNKYFSDLMKKILTKNLWRQELKKTMKILRNLLNVGFAKMILKSEITVLSLENIEFLHIEIVISMLNHKILVVYHNLKNYDSHLIMQELSNFDLKVSVLLNRLEKHMSFTINNNLRFIDSFQFLSSSLDSLAKNVSKHDVKSRIW